LNKNYPTPALPEGEGVIIPSPSGRVSLAWRPPMPAAWHGAQRGAEGRCVVLSGIYLHIPFCDTKCIYCDFYSITNHTKKSEFINAILKEIDFYSPLLSDYKFDTIFFGGGTPSLLAKKDFELIFEALYKKYSISSNCEITIEANPGTLDRQKLGELKSLPVNRISFGVQSFNNNDLKFLTRIHSSEEAINSIRSAQDAGFENINLDLIFALPGQTMEAWKFNLEKAVSLNTHHISAYSLIFEENTVLYNMRKLGQVKNAEIELEREMFDFTSEYLVSAGFEHYEISNFAKPGFQCRHNLKYWQREQYISFGPSASSFIGNKRWTNVRNLIKYIKSVESGLPLGKSAVDFEEEISKDTAITEHIFLGLRSKGIDLVGFKNIFNYDFKDKYLTSINTLVNGGFAEVNDNLFRLTQKGYAVCDEIAARYF